MTLLLFMAVSLATYFYAVADVPRRDHIAYMLERAYFGDIWDWLMHSISWSRTRILWPGDYFLFRPLHMAALAIKDIFLRDNIFASGAINISFMGIAGFSLYTVSRRFVGQVIGAALAVLFMVQHAGLEMVAWGHISPYLLSLAFFGFALNEIMKTEAQGLSPLRRAGVFLLLGALFHEIIIVALVLTAVPVLFVMWRTGGKAVAGSVPLRKHLLWIIIFPVLAYLGLDLLDYLSHGAPAILGPQDNSMGIRELFSAILMAAGAPAVALLAPFKVSLVMGSTGIFAWDFSGMMPFVLGAGGVLGVALLLGLSLCVRGLRKEGPAATMASLLTTSMFFAFIIGVGYGRVYHRGASYLYEATYYYSVTGYVLCLLVAAALRPLSARVSSFKWKRYAGAGALVLIVALVAVNFTKTFRSLKNDWPHRSKAAIMQLRVGKALSVRGGDYCLAGFSPGSGSKAMGLPGMLLRDHFCRPGDARTPVYLTSGDDGSLWLAEISKLPLAAEAVDMEGTSSELEILKPSFQLKDLIPEMPVFMSRETRDRPDISLTLRHGVNATVFLGYRDAKNYLAFKIDGPIAFGRFSRDGKLSLIHHRTAIPSVRPEYRIEVRHAGPYIYFFVDDWLMAALPAEMEEAGKVGIAYQKTKTGEASFENFAVAPPGKNMPPVFTPTIRISGGQ